MDGDADTVIDDGCPSTKYTYDALNRLQSETDALGRVTSYAYNAELNYVEKTDARGLNTRQILDDAGRLDKVEHRNVSGGLVDTVDFTYDNAGNRTRMDEIAGTTKTTTYAYDALNRRTSITHPGNAIVGYEYDVAPGGAPVDYPGQRTKVIYPTPNTSVSYTYDHDGRMKTVTDWLGKQTAYSYDDAGRLATALYPTGKCTSYAYDQADRLTSVANKTMAAPPTCAATDPVVSSFAYTVDAVGNRMQMVDSLGTHVYKYDALRRLTQSDYPGADIDTYTYDANGNRLTKTTTAGTTNYTYDFADQMKTVGSVAHQYDNNGNLTNRGTADGPFKWDHENRLTETKIAGATATSTYNGDGLRTSHTSLGLTTNYTWDVASGLPVVLEDGTNRYVYGLDLISATNSGGAQTYLLYDGLGSTTEVVNGTTGATAMAFRYDVFGAIRWQNPAGAAATNWLFTGEQRDSNEGLYYLRARYYDQATGRFLSPDPLPGGNLYAYVGNDPVNLVDPYGLFGFKDIKQAVSRTVHTTVEAAKFTAPYLGECAIWGGAAFIGTGGNLAATGIGCATGVTARVVEELSVSNPLVECLIWGAGGFGVASVAAKTAIAVAAAPKAGAAGCVSGATSWALSELGLSNTATQCGAWSMPIGFVTHDFWQRAFAMAGGCFGGVADALVEPKE